MLEERKINANMDMDAKLNIAQDEERIDGKRIKDDIKSDDTSLDASLNMRCKYMRTLLRAGTFIEALSDMLEYEKTTFKDEVQINDYFDFAKSDVRRETIRSLMLCQNIINNYITTELSIDKAGLQKEYKEWCDSDLYKE